MNLLLEHSKFVKYHTYLGPIFSAAPELAEFTYLISNVEVGATSDHRLASDPLVISGRELRSLVEKEKVQFIWAVLSAFDHEPDVPAELPYADGNRRFWEGSPRPQIAKAKFEIVCWDSSATLFIGVGDSTGAKLLKKYPDIRDLDGHNRKKE